MALPRIPKNYRAKQGQLEFYQGNGDSAPATPKPSAPAKRLASKKNTNGKKKTNGKAAPVARKNNSTRTSFMDDMYKGMRGQ
jgi:hypothetical protein